MRTRKDRSAIRPKGGVMTQKEKIAFVKQTLENFAKIERKHTDEAGWIALKLSCSRDVAERLIEKAKA